MRLSLQKGSALVLVGNDVVAVEDGPRSVTRDFHGHPLRNPGTYHVPDRRPPKIMEELPARLVVEAKELSRQLFATHEAFDFDFSLPDVNGETVSLADYSGKVLIVDFCGTTYPPCRKAIPHLVYLLEKYKDAGLDIVGIHYENIEAEAAKKKIESFAAEYGIVHKCLIGDEDTRSRVPEFGGYPTTLFLDRSGVVRLKVMGIHPMEQLEAFVETLLEEPAEEDAERASATELP